MAGGKARLKKDKAIKISGGELVRTGQILSRGVNTFKAGKNTKGENTIYALCSGKVVFSRKKTSRGRDRTYINIAPQE